MKSFDSIAVKDAARARAFYDGLLGSDEVIFEHSTERQISIKVDRSIDELLDFVWANGGRILSPEPLVTGELYAVAILDTEGNRVVLKSSTREQLRRSA